MEVGKEWTGQGAVWRGILCRSDGKIIVGVCAREKKARSKHMEAITSRLDSEKFDVMVFGDDCILNTPVEDWPMCDCLVAFYSTGFPSDKARAYVELRRPYALNNLEMENVLHDRRKVYDLLKENRVPHPDNVYASRDGYGGQEAGELTIVEADDYIQVNSVTIHKPFVEKPVDAEDHNVYIYYPMSAGGGSKRLFRKIGDRSSEFYPHVNEIRREGSFVYEAFVETQGTDVKVYTVGPDYGHAEARKSPTLDGKVNRNAEGKEIRYPVILSKEEKEYARRITLAFKQCVCGFDILRVQGRSYVCDVNGWSFVKNSRKYVEDCAMLLEEFIEAAVKPGRRTRVFSTEAPLIKYGPFKANDPQQREQQRQQQQQQPADVGGSSTMAIEKPPCINTNVPSSDGHGHRLNYTPHSPDSSVGSASTPGSREPQLGNAFAAAGSPTSTPPRSPAEGKSKQPRKHSEELRAVIAITRHGDRTPKQKMKMNISFPPFLAFYNKYSPGPRKEIKVKGKAHLKEFLGITVELIKTLVRARNANEISEKKSPGFPHVVVAVLGGYTGGGHGGRAQEGTDKGNGNSNEDLDGNTDVDAETFGKLHQIKHVLERWEISGINRKLQLKPLQWEEFEPEDDLNGVYDNDGGVDGGAQTGTKANGVSPQEPLQSSAEAAVGISEDIGALAGVADDFSSSVGGEGVKGGGKSGGKRERVTELLLILKWGGELTNLGQRQAIELGNSFRTIMYPDAGSGGLLRLHSTFRHDLKIKTSDEGRVMKTAAAFAKGFLELEGELTPILVSLVSKESSKNHSVTMLDPSGNKDIKKEMERSKEFLHRVMSKDLVFTPEVIKSVVPAGQASVRRALRSVGNPVAKLRNLRQLVAALVKQLSRRSATFPMEKMDSRVSAADRELDRGIEADEFATSRVEMVEIEEARKKRNKTDQDLVSSDSTSFFSSSLSSRSGRDSRLAARGETPLLMHDRWRKLHDELYDHFTDHFDISKIPDVHDNARYDGLHNAHLELEGLHELYDLAKHLADAIVPQEYGITKRGKLTIGAKMCRALLEKIKYDLIIARADNEVDMRYQLDISNVEDLPINSLGRRVRTRLYFTSESHLHTLLNVLRFPSGDRQPVVTDEARRMLSRTKELCYLTSFVIRLFEDAEKDTDDPARFRVEILFSPGVVKHPLLSGDHLHTAPLVHLHKNLTFDQVEDTLDAAIALSTKNKEDIEDNEDGAESESDLILNKLEAVMERQQQQKQQQEQQQKKQQQQQKQQGKSENSDGIAESVNPLSTGGSLGATVTGATGTTGTASMTEEGHKKKVTQRTCLRDPRNQPQHRGSERGRGLSRAERFALEDGEGRGGRDGKWATARSASADGRIGVGSLESAVDGDGDHRYPVPAACDDDDPLAASEGGGAASADGTLGKVAVKPGVRFADDFRSLAEEAVMGATASDDQDLDEDGERVTGRGDESSAVGSYLGDREEGGSRLRRRRRSDETGDALDRGGLDVSGQGGGWEGAAGRSGGSIGCRDDDGDSDIDIDSEIDRVEGRELDNDGFESDDSDLGRAVQARLASDPFLPSGDAGDMLRRDSNGGSGSDNISCSSAPDDDADAADSCFLEGSAAATERSGGGHGDGERPFDPWPGGREDGTGRTRLAVAVLAGALSVVAAAVVAIAVALAGRRRPR